MVEKQTSQDFWISYTSSDRAWAEWIAWVLEENDYIPRLQSWDVHLEDDWRNKIKEIEASLENQLSIIVFSESFLERLGTRTTWDPMDSDVLKKSAFELRKVVDRQLKGPLKFLPNSQLLPIRVADCQLAETFVGVTYLDLVGLSESESEKSIAKRLEALSGKTTTNIQVPMPGVDIPKRLEALSSETTADSKDSLDNLVTATELSLEAVKDSDQFMRKQRSVSVECFVEHLNDSLSFEMMRIPTGNFQMGSPEDELERRDDEGPQHPVSVSEFFMAKYPVTQLQWRVVFAMPQINRRLEADPSEFKGDNRPVETVSWYDAVEFCERLSIYTNRCYRLPTEAEWEYACRAVTKTPFHFGETITTELANYQGIDSQTSQGSGAYGSGPKGVYLGETTPVDYFDFANAFGLCDLHGNVLEWCQDKDYRKSVNKEAYKNVSQPLRGGSWNHLPRGCRSACRVFSDPYDKSFNFGFRICCSRVQRANEEPLEKMPDILRMLRERNVRVPDDARGAGQLVKVGRMSGYLYAFIWELAETNEWSALFMLCGLGKNELLPVGAGLQVSDQTSVLSIANVEPGEPTAYLYVQGIGDLDEQFTVEISSSDGRILTLPPFRFESKSL